MLAQILWYVVFLLLLGASSAVGLKVLPSLVDPKQSSGRIAAITLLLAPVNAFPLFMVWALSGIWETRMLLIVLAAFLVAQLVVAVLNGVLGGDPDGAARSVRCWTAFAVVLRHPQLKRFFATVVGVGGLAFFVVVTWVYFRTDYRSVDAARALTRLIFGYVAISGLATTLLSSGLLLTYDEIEARYRDRLFVATASSLIPTAIWISLFMFTFNSAEASMGLELSPEVTIFLVGLLIVGAILPYLVGNNLARSLIDWTHRSETESLGELSRLVASPQPDRGRHQRRIHDWRDRLAENIDQTTEKIDIEIAARLKFSDFDALKQRQGDAPIEAALAGDPTGQYIMNALARSENALERMRHVETLMWMDDQAQQVESRLGSIDDPERLRQALSFHADALEDQEIRLRAQSKRELARKAPIALGISTVALFIWSGVVGTVNTALQQTVNDVLIEVGVPIESDDGDGAREPEDSVPATPPPTEPRTEQVPVPPTTPAATAPPATSPPPDTVAPTTPPPVNQPPVVPEPTTPPVIPQPPPTAATATVATSAPTEERVVIVPDEMIDWAIRAYKINGREVILSVADTPEKQGSGIAGITDLYDLDGVLYVFDQEMVELRHLNGEGQFTIDIVWFDANGTSVAIAREVPGCDLGTCDEYWSDDPAQFVIEAPTGLFGNEWPIILAAV